MADRIGGSVDARLGLTAQGAVEGMVRSRAVPVTEGAVPRAPAAVGRADIARLLQQATAERDAGALEQAEDLYWPALDLAIEYRSRQQEGWAWDGLGSCRARHRDHGMALRFFTRADRLADETGDTLLKAWCLHNFGSLRREHGDVPAARDFFEQCLAVAEAHQRPVPAGWTHHQLAELARDESDARQELEHYAAAARAGLACHDDALAGWSLIHLARCTEQSGALGEANDHYVQAAGIGSRFDAEMLRQAEEGLARTGR